MAVLPKYIDFRYRFAPSVTDIANDGYPRWDQTLVQGLLTLPTSLTAPVFPISVTANAGANDAVLGVDEWDWYFDQRTDDSSRQYLVMTQPNIAKSGTISIALTALGVTKWAATSADNIYRLVIDTYLYAVEKATGNIYWGDFTKSMFSQA